MSLIAATRSEGTKLFSTSVWWILAIVLFFYVATSASGLGFVFAGVKEGIIPGDTAGLPVPDNVAPLLYSFASTFGFVFALLIGTLMVTSEFRHQTLTPTFLATPRRGIALTAKLLLGVVLGVLYAVIALISTVGPAAGVLAVFGQDTQLADADTWAMFGRIVLAFIIWTIMGVGVGALARNQVVAVVGVLAFTQFLEPLIRLAAAYIPGADGAAAYLPGAAADALVGQSFYTIAAGGGTGADPLAWWVGGVVLAVYALVFVVLGHLFRWRRDVS